MLFRILLCAIVGLYFVACSEKVEEPPKQEQVKSPLTTLGDENLETLMDKIFAHFAYLPADDEAMLESLLPKQAKDDIKFTPVDKKRYEITKLLWEAYAQNKAHNIESETLERALGLEQEWKVLIASATPYMKLPLLEKIDAEIALSLGLLFLNNNNGDESTLATLLESQHQFAKGSGELNVIIESQIQVQLLALFGLYQLDSINQSMEHLASHKVRARLEESLEKYKDFLKQEHYDVYYRAFSLLKDEIIKSQSPMDRIFAKLLSYPQVRGISLTNDDTYLHIERISKAYEILKIKERDSALISNIINVAQNPLKNVYSDELLANYLYGLDYLSLSILGDDINANLPLALKHLQKDFKTFQILEHRFEEVSFQNYMSSIFIGAHILSQIYHNQEYFEELLRLAKSELAEYRDAMNHNDVEMYEDALFILEQTDRDKFLEITFLNNAPKDEKGYIKVALSLSPYEISQIKNINLKENNALRDNKEVCLSPAEVNFMLSLNYQAYRANGFDGSSPEMFQIRLDEVLGIEDFYKSPLAKHLVDFDSFMVLGVADKQCHIQGLSIDERLNTFADGSKFCGYNLYFDKENGFVIDEILPSRVLEQVADGNLYYRLKSVDVNINRLLFHNDENALKALKSAQNTGEILPVLVAFFPKIKEYLSYRLSSPQEAQKLISKAKPKPCKP